MLAQRRSQRCQRWKEEFRRRVRNIAGATANPRWPHRMAPGKGRLDEEENMSIYEQYVARVEQLPTTYQPGYTEYKRVSRVELEIWSHKKQLQELRKVGVEVNSSDEALKLFVRPDEGTYPQTFTQMTLPDVKPKHLKTAELLHHRLHMKGKMARLHTRLRELKREGRMMLRARRRDMADIADARFLSQGVGRTRMIYETHIAIRKHSNLLKAIEKTIKARLKSFQRNSSKCYVDPDNEPIAVEKGLQRVQIRKKRNHCRHHIRIPKQTETLNSETTKTENVLSQEQLAKRERLDKWRATNQLGVQYTEGTDRVGDYSSDKMTNVEESRILRVCTLNINGLDDNKLELVLQFFAEEHIDVMFLIDARMDAKSGRYTGKKVKRRLGVGTRTHTNPCILDYGMDQTGGFKRIGGIFVIVSPKWGTSLKNIQDDQLGPNDGPAGVMSQITLATSDGHLNIIGSYWPNKHGAADTSEQNLWRCLARYVAGHRGLDRNPLALMQRLAGVWTQTAIKNGSKGTVLCGDLNATWTGDEPGGQTVLERWATDLSFVNGIRGISQRIGTFMHTRGDEGQPKTWIDHILHKGGEEHIQLAAGYVSHSPLWEGIFFFAKNQ